MELTRSEEIRLMIEGGAGSVMTLPEIIAAEIGDFLISPQYDIMKQADDYYRNRSDVQRKENKYKNRSNTKIEHPILKKLVEHKGKLLTYSVLLDSLWDEGVQLMDKHALAVNINRLRKKLEAEGHTYISNVYGMGYIWK